MQLPLENPRPDMYWFKQVILGEIIPSRPPVAEMALDRGIVSIIAEQLLGRKRVTPKNDRESRAAYWDNRIEVLRRLGYDFIWVTGGLNFPCKERVGEDTAELSKGTRVWAEEGTGIIANWEDMESYPWPSLDEVDLWDYEYVATHVPEGMGVCVCASDGFLEISLNTLLGYENMAYLLYDDPQLIESVFARVAESIHGFYRMLLGLPNLLGFFNGDDMGFKTSTLLSPAVLRRYVLPEHKKLAQMAHENSLLYILHSCGNIEAIMEDLIEDVKIDAKHSFDDEAMPVIEFKQKYGHRVGVLGGVDMDKLCRLPEEELRRYVRTVLDQCMPYGRFALGSGNTVANYVPVKNYLIMLEEAYNYGK